MTTALIGWIGENLWLTLHPRRDSVRKDGTVKAQLIRWVYSSQNDGARPELEQE